MKKTILIADVKKDFYVRKQLDDERVLMFAALYESGAKVPPIVINEDNVLIDGRHRLEAREYLDFKNIEAEVREITDKVKLITEAFRSNVGGPLPPTLQDTEQTIEMLLELGETRKSIAKHLRMPPAMIRKLVGNVQSRLARKKLQAAASSVTEGGLTVVKAAEQYKVDIDALKETLSPRRNKKHGIPEIQRQLTSTYKSVSIKNSKLCKSLLEKFEDGDLTEKQTREILDHLSTLTRQTYHNVMEWKGRFNAMTNTGEPETKSESATTQ